MLNYTKSVDVSRVIPRTFGRYSVDIKGTLQDNLTGVEIEWATNEDSSEYCFPMLGTVYDGMFSPEEIICLTYKPIHIPGELLDKVVLLFRQDFSDPFRKFHPAGFVWCFPEGIELPTYPGYRVIPGFSRYVVNRDGVVVSTYTGEVLEQYTANTGYPACRLQCDDDCSKIMSVHVLVALAWCPYDSSVCEMQVDHLDGCRDNRSADNLEWVSPDENCRRARLHQYHGVKGRKVWIRDVLTGEARLFESAAAVARYFGVGNSAIFGYLNSPNPNAVFQQTHLIWYDGFGTGEIRPEHLLAREGSQKRQLDVKNLSEGVITRFESVADFVRVSGLTRKQVYGNLKLGKQKQFGDIIFKYSDDDSNWVV